MSDLVKELFDILMDVCSGKMKVDEARKKAIKARENAGETVSDDVLAQMDKRIAELEGDLPASER